MLTTRPLSWLQDFITDREFFARLFKLALPIIAQQFIMSSLNLVNGIMVGQLGETAVAAVGLSNQVYFLLNLLLFGVNSGAAIFTAQYWGKGDVPSIRKVMGLALLVGLAGGLLFTIVALFFPQVALGFYSTDPAVIALGSSYLRIYALSFLFTSVTFCYAFVLRSVGNVRLPMIVSIGALSLNSVLAYTLIFGKLGLPVMGINGAAVSIAIARFLECAVLLWLAYRLRTPAAARLPEMFHFDREFAGRVLRRVLPVMLNEVFWSLGITTYNAIYAHIGTDSIAAMNIASTFDGLAIVLIIGIGNACAILVGNVIGAGDEKKAFRYAGKSLALAMLGSLLIGVLVWASSGWLLLPYKVSPEVAQYAQRVLWILAATLWLRSANMVLYVGIFRSGGDTRFAFILDAGSIWVVGVPLALLGAFALHLPVYWVYLMVMGDELTKCASGLFRYFSRKWIHNLTVT